MNSKANTLPVPATASWTDRLLRKRVFALLERLRECQITVEENGHERTFGDGQSELDVLRARVTVHDPDFYRSVALGGSIGAAEAFMLGSWDCDDLTALLSALVRNRDLLDEMETGMARLTRPMLHWLHKRNRNTRSGSRRNIAAHYDLGNEFFELFLDDNLMYSSAVFRSQDETLEQASRHKLDRICQKLELGPDDHVLEIGTGWGGFALHAVQNTGCRVTTTTISKRQYEKARQRIDAAGLGDRITLLRQDYRELTGQFDKLVSIEMIEAVGHQYLETYLQQCSQLLVPGGSMLLQAITIEDHRYARALRSVDFIQRYIFPGSFIPSVAAITGAAARRTDFRLFHLEDIGPSYARTLREWRERFLRNLDQVEAMGYPDSFVRMWLFYFAYCEAGFLERSIGDVQMLLTKPRNRRESLLSSL